jgi:predicted transcriptional regulator
MMDMDLLPMVAEIVSAQTSHAPTTREELTEAIRLVYTTLSGLAAQGAPETGGVAQSAAPVREPAVAIEESVFPDYIVCLEDGKELKTLRRHLMVAYGMSPEEYRTRWNLPSTYPVTAPNYSEHRSRIAAASGFGRKPGSMKPAPVPVQRVKAGVSGKRGRGRPRKDAA